MAKTQTLHVVPNDGAWAIRATPGKKTWSFATKQDAIDEARRRVSHNVSRIIVHGKSGQIFQNITAPRELTYAVVRDAVRSTKSISAKRSSEKVSPRKKVSVLKKVSKNNRSKAAHAR